MAYALGIILFALGILVAVALHEAGHMFTARGFGMKVTRFFIGFGPTIFAFNRRGIEYGLKALPFGAFVKIIGMTPDDDDVKPEDESKAMWRFPVWKRTIVMSAGSISHFILAIVTLWIVFVAVGIPDGSKVDQVPVKVAATQTCVAPKYVYDPQTKAPKACDPASDPKSPAAQLGLRPGDVITKLDDTAVPNSPALRDGLKTYANQNVTVTYTRDGKTMTGTAFIPQVDRIKSDVDPNKTADQITPADLEQGGMLGISIDVYSELPLVRSGPVEGIGNTFKTLGTMVTRTFESLKQIPAKVPKLLSAIAGHKRDPETPVSVVGASRIGGQLFEVGDWTNMLTLFATLNLFFGIFNLFPLLPMDGGHIAIAWFERVRSWLAAKRGRPDPGRVDYVKLAPITLGVIGVLGVFVLLTVTADIVNPISIK
jgi:membrane-associated protease RseP (regulator of RpoE activity)